MITITEKEAIGRNGIVRLGEPAENPKVEELAKELFLVFGKAFEPKCTNDEILKRWDVPLDEEDLLDSEFAFRCMALHLLDQGDEENKS